MNLHSTSLKNQCDYFPGLECLKGYICMKQSCRCFFGSYSAVSYDWVLLLEASRGSESRCWRVKLMLIEWMFCQHLGIISVDLYMYPPWNQQFVPENWWLECQLPFGIAHFRSYVGFREGMSWNSWLMKINLRSSYVTRTERSLNSELLVLTRFSTLLTAFLHDCFEICIYIYLLF